jgi:hypothetical protein
MSDNNPMAEIDVELQPQAQQAARKHINQFAVALIMQAKTLAYSKRANRVLATHVEEALEVLNEKGQRAWPRELAIIIGSTLFGVFLQGFTSNLSSGNAFLLAAYTLMGFVGIFMVFWGLRRWAA